VTLDNGSTNLATQIGLSDTSGTDRITVNGYVTQNAGGAYQGINVDPITGETSYHALTWSEYHQAWLDIENKSAQVEANAEVYADGLYNMSQSGELNATTYVSPSTLAQEYSTDYSTTGYYAYAVAYAGAAGFAVPDMNETAVMTIQTGAGTYEGLLMSQNAPAGGLWEVGVTYDAAAIQGKQFVARTDGNISELKGEFTITEMLDESGSAVQNTTTQETVYTVSNVSQSYAALQKQIRALQTEIYEEEADGLSGPLGSGGSIGNIGWIAVGVIALVGVGALYSSSSTAGRRRRR
jgi:hypothetical protein